MLKVTFCVTDQKERRANLMSGIRLINTDLFSGGVVVIWLGIVICHVFQIELTHQVQTLSGKSSNLTYYSSHSLLGTCRS